MIVRSMVLLIPFCVLHLEVQADIRATIIDGEVSLLDGDHLIAVYSFDHKQIRRPFFAHIKAPNGFQVTRHFPPREGIDPDDHADMHPGMWMAFGKVSGGDFWRNKDVVRHERFTRPPESSPAKVRFSVENSYMLDGNKICSEHTSYSIIRKEHGYLYSCDATFQAIEPIVFGDQQEMGLGLRLATSLQAKGGQGEVRTSTGADKIAQAWGKRAAWCDYSAPVNGQRVGALVMAHPENFRPSRMHVRDYGLLVANPFAEKDFGAKQAQSTELAAGEELRLRFGVFVYAMPANEQFDPPKLFDEYIASPLASTQPTGKPWQRHIIDAGSRGADGVRVGDINRDGRPDLVTGWEEGGEVRLYLHPGSESIRKTWPFVTVGKVRAPEDAVFADVDSDGRLDVVSSCEGIERTVFVHWAPQSADQLLDPNGWRTEAIPATRNAALWMFCLPMSIRQDHGTRLVLGAKGPNAQVGWLEATREHRDLSGWQWHPIYDAGWIMSLRAHDMNGDGDNDIVLSDRRGPESGCWWLERPTDIAEARQSWKKHLIGGRGLEVMFLDVADIDLDGIDDVAVAVSGGEIRIFKQQDSEKGNWQDVVIPMPAMSGTGKAVAVGDIDGDGANDLVVTCEHAEDKHGVFWLRQEVDTKTWSPQTTSGTEAGIKFDRIELLDLDQDGDLDVITCEERDNLGVIWFENPSNQ